MAEVRWLTEDEQTAWRSLITMYTRLHAQLARELAAVSDLTYGDYGVLVALTDRPEPRARMYELADDLGWERSRVSHQVSRMVTRGWVRKERCDDDRRGSWVVLTDRGRGAIEAAAPSHVESVRRLFVDRLTPAELRTLTTLTQKVLTTLD
ncbi:MAG TPA: MarR family transcriptional regulator [Acidimicrobiales bacterium]